MEYKLGIEYTEHGIEPVIVGVERKENSCFNIFTPEYIYRRLIFDFNNNGKPTILMTDLKSTTNIASMDFFKETGILIVVDDVVPYLKHTKVDGYYTFIKEYSRQIYCGKDHFQLLPFNDNIMRS